MSENQDPNQPTATESLFRRIALASFAENDWLYAEIEELQRKIYELKKINRALVKPRTGRLV